METRMDLDNSEWQVRHRHEIAMWGRPHQFVTVTDAQHNHDVQVLIDRLDLARAELVIARAEAEDYRDRCQQLLDRCAVLSANRVSDGGEINGVGV